MLEASLLEVGLLSKVHFLYPPFCVYPFWLDQPDQISPVHLVVQLYNHVLYQTVGDVGVVLSQYVESLVSKLLLEGAHTADIQGQGGVEAADIYLQGDVSIRFW